MALRIALTHYYVGEKGSSKVVTHDFYVSDYKNYNSKDTMKKEKFGRKSQIVKKVNNEYGSYRYYIKVY